MDVTRGNMQHAYMVSSFLWTVAAGFGRLGQGGEQGRNALHTIGGTTASVQACIVLVAHAARIECCLHAVSTVVSLLRGSLPLPVSVTYGLLLPSDTSNQPNKSQPESWLHGAAQSHCNQLYRCMNLIRHVAVNAAHTGSLEWRPRHCNHGLCLGPNRHSCWFMFWVKGKPASRAAHWHPCHAPNLTAALSWHSCFPNYACGGPVVLPAAMFKHPLPINVAPHSTSPPAAGPPAAGPPPAPLPPRNACRCKCRT